MEMGLKKYLKFINENYITIKNELINNDHLESDAIYYRGFIFKDGSIIEIGDGYDHRVIDINDWDKYNIITYHYEHKKNTIFLRIHLPITYKQINILKDFIYDKEPFVIVDFYKNNKYFKYYEIDGYDFLDLLNKFI